MAEMNVKTDTENENGTPPEHEYLTFRLAGETYGIPILSVQEIIGHDPATPVPNTPEWMSGVINIRGIIIPVIDMRARFGMAEGTYDETTVVIIARVDERVMGVVVDEVQDVLGFTEDNIQDTPPVSGPKSTQFVSGLGKRDGQTIMLLAIEDLLLSCIQEEQAA
jgi:purine-binding chemotaxis protein CheW